MGSLDDSLLAILSPQPIAEQAVHEEEARVSRDENPQPDPPHRSASEQTSLNLTEARDQQSDCVDHRLQSKAMQSTTSWSDRLLEQDCNEQVRAKDPNNSAATSLQISEVCRVGGCLIATVSFADSPPEQFAFSPKAVEAMKNFKLSAQAALLIIYTGKRVHVQDGHGLKRFQQRKKVSLGPLSRRYSILVNRKETPARIEAVENLNTDDIRGLSKARTWRVTCRHGKKKLDQKHGRWRDQKQATISSPTEFPTKAHKH